MFCFVVRQNWSQEQIERPWSISVTSATAILICKDVYSIYSSKSVGSSRVHFIIWRFGILILIDTIDVSDCFLIQNSGPVELGLQGVHSQILAKVQIKPVGL